LRWLSGLHHLALRGLLPWAALWPPAMTDRDDAALDTALDTAIALAWSAERQTLQRALSGPPQTNEVQRSAVLLPGLLYLAQQTPWPLALLEIGASAGLNLWLDHYRYEHEDNRCDERVGPQRAWTWGDPASGLTLRPQWSGAAPPQSELHIQRRAGCDALPVDLNDAAQALRLASYVWPEQQDRLARLRAAQTIVRRCMASAGLSLQAAAAATFVRQQLAQRRPRQTTVLMHSVVWQYLAAAEQADISAQMLQAGRAAGAQAPLAWLRMEPADDAGTTELRCRLW